MQKSPAKSKDNNEALSHISGMTQISRRCLEDNGDANKQQTQ